MDRLESFVISSFIAVLVPVCLFVAAWWLSVGIVPERWIPVCAFGGLGLGVLLTVTRPMIAALVAIGWPVLVLAQYWCTTKAAVIAYGTHEDIEQRCR